MKNKEKHAMGNYLEAGAAMRLLTEVGNKAISAASAILSAKDADKFVHYLNGLDLLKAKADTNLFDDYPELGHEGTNVFYGRLKDKPESDLDTEVINMAKAMAEDLFNRRG